MAYATAAELASLVDYTVDAAKAELLLDIVSGMIDHEVDRPLLAAPVTETVKGHGSPTLMLSRWPVASVTSGTVDGDPLDAAEYDWDRSGWITRTGSARRWSGLVTVVYESGFDANSPELATARGICLVVAADVAANPSRLSTLSADGVSPGFGPGLEFTEHQLGQLSRLRSTAHP